MYWYVYRVCVRRGMWVCVGYVYVCMYVCMEVGSCERGMHVVGMGLQALVGVLSLRELYASYISLQILATTMSDSIMIAIPLVPIAYCNVLFPPPPPPCSLM